MLFYTIKIACTLHDNGKLLTAFNESRDSWFSQLEDINELLASSAHESKLLLIVYKASKEEFSLIAMANTLEPFDKCKILKFLMSHLCEKFELTFSNKMQFKEITPTEVKNIVEHGSRFITHHRRWDSDEYYFDYYNNRTFKIQESLLNNQPLPKKKAYQEAFSIMADESMLDELSRIYSANHPQKFQGHPIHYKLSVGNQDAAKQLIDLLCHALYVNHRLIGRCVSRIYNITEDCYEEYDIKSIFRQSVGGTVIINLSGSKEEHQNYTTCYEEVVLFFAEQIRKYQRNTLFILIENTNNPGFAHNLITSLQDELFFVEIKEGRGNRQKSTAYLQKLLTQSNVRYTTEQVEQALGEKTSFRSSDIHKIHDQLYRDNLRNNAYTAYQNVSRVTLSKKNYAPQSAYTQLDAMIGLKEVKTVINNILDTFRARKLRSSMGLDNFRPNMHMVFTGNPGSAKTTVARLVSEILNKEGILSSGEFVECGRADLVGKYVGWTAPQVKKMFRSAQGGVLFIDEAYSLVDDISGSFGDEAISTIVQEMENHRDDTIVIFAGYPDKMEQFLEKNEGLRSRIAFHVNFPNYSPHELLDILHLMASQRDLKLAADIDDKCLKIFSEACQQPNFGNGRFVRNLLEQAQLKQSSRIMQEYNGKEIDRHILLELKKDDFDVNVVKQHLPYNRLMGFRPNSEL